MRLFLSGIEKERAIQVKEYSANRSSKLGITPVIVTAILGQLKQGLEEPQPDWLASLPPDQGKRVKKAWTSIETEWTEHVKNRAAYDVAEETAKSEAKATRDAEAAAKEKDKKESIEVMAKAGVKSDAIVSKALSNVEASMKSFIGDKLMISTKTGRIVIRKDQVLTKADFASVLANFDTFEQYGEAIREEASAREAQVAVLAKKKLGDGWKALYAERPRALARVGKYIKVYETMNLLGKEDFGTISNTRKALEINVASETDTKEQALAKNLEAKGKVVDTIIALQAKNKKPATQAEITQIVNQTKMAYGIKKDLKFPCVYIIPDREGRMFTAGGALRDKRLQSVMSFAITSQMTKIILKDGVPVEVKITAPNDKRNAYIDELIAAVSGVEPDEPPTTVKGTTLKPSVTEGKKPAKKEAAPDPTATEEEEEEEDENEQVPNTTEEKENDQVTTGGVEEEEDDEPDQTPAATEEEED